MNKMVKILLLVFFGTLMFFLGTRINGKKIDKNIVPIEIIREKPLEKYTIENLSKRKPLGTSIEVGEELYKGDGFTAQLFSFTTSGKKVTGQINVPDKEGSYPLVLMFRGYVDQTIYSTGIGTKSAGDYFSENGFITVAPDFLGYGGSDKESGNIFETRFQTYTTALDLLNSLSSITGWDKKNLFIWGHSNGGQIALTLLEITQREIPTTLWAPVSKPFPYSILYYTDESEDRGKLIRKELSAFEGDYDPDLYSLDLYFDRINASLQLHQGTLDDAVPKEWSDSLVKKLESLDKSIDYFVYPGADHNLKPSWNTVVLRDLSFFKKHLVN